jgi:potassium voltage-gated channel Eag-related subfamily H protein 7
MATFISSTRRVNGMEVPSNTSTSSGIGLSLPLTDAARVNYSATDDVHSPSPVSASNTFRQTRRVEDMRVEAARHSQLLSDELGEALAAIDFGEGVSVLLADPSIQNSPIVLAQPPDPTLIGQPVVWHARVKKSFEAERLVNFAQSFASEVHEFGPCGNPSYGSALCPRQDVDFAFLTVDVASETQVLLLLGRVGGPALAMIIVQLVLRPYESAADALGRVVPQLHMIGKSAGVMHAFGDPLWLTKKEMSIAAIAEARARCTHMKERSTTKSPNSATGKFGTEYSERDSTFTMDLMQKKNASVRGGVNFKTLIVDHEGAFFQCWTIILFFFTCGTALLTPFEIAFIRTRDPLAYVNIGMNSFFWIDLAINFRVTRDVVDRQKGSVVRIETGPAIAKGYLRGWFLLDFLSVFPFEDIGALFGGTFTGGNSMRMLRCLRLVKLLRLLRGSRAFNTLQQQFSVSYAIQDFTKLLLLTAFVCHLMACGFGFVAYLDTENREVGWVQRLVREDRLEVKDTCMEDYSECPPGSAAVQGKLYVYAFYWAIATCTTIGYGDIVPRTIPETLVSVSMMLFAGFFWSWVLGTSCNIAGALSESTTQFKRNVDSVNRLINDCNLSGSLSKDLRSYLYCSEKIIVARQYQNVLTVLSPELQGRVVFEWFGEWVLGVPYIGKGSPPFVVEVARNLALQMYAPKEVIIQRRTLFALERGVVWRKMATLLKGNVWGVDMLLQSPLLRDETSALCLTVVELRYQAYQTFAMILENHPTDKQRVRSYCVKLAVLRGVCNYARKVREAEREIFRLPGLQEDIVGVNGAQPASPGATVVTLEALHRRSSKDSKGRKISLTRTVSKESTAKTESFRL